MGALPLGKVNQENYLGRIRQVELGFFFPLPYNTRYYEVCLNGYQKTYQFDKFIWKLQNDLALGKLQGNCKKVKLQYSLCIFFYKQRLKEGVAGKQNLTIVKKEQKMFLKSIFTSNKIDTCLFS